MLKWAKNKNSNKTMSGAVKQRVAAPSMASGKTQSTPRMMQTHMGDIKQTRNGSATLSYPSETSDDVNMNEVDGLVALDVILPNGDHMDITVDYNTPMLDLLVCLAGKCKLSPSGLILQLLSEESVTLNYKPNQIIGSLGGRQVRLVDKKTQEALKKKNKGGKKPFEMTNRFTVNLPRGQKAVVRVSPNMPLGDLMLSVCRDKDLDPGRHHLQLPGKPGLSIDLNATVGQLGGFEINLIGEATRHDNNIMASSMPDLSQVPTYMPNAGETKKKRGFLSFLSKKDNRKFKPDPLQNLETSSTGIHHKSSLHNRKSTSPPPSAQRRVSDTGLQSSRPKSMFVSSTHDPREFSLPQKENMGSQVITAPTRKKRRAPAPPTPSEPVASQSQQPVSSSKQDINSNENTDRTQNGMGGEISSSQNKTASSIAKAQSAPSKAEMLSRYHSRNSSDSSGYHELTLSGCESPEAGHALASKSKTSIDSTSIESSDINNGADSGIHESPVRVSPIEEVLEKSDSLGASYNSNNNAINSATLPLPSRKKKKAPAPPAPTAPAPAPSVHPPTQQTVVESTPADILHQDSPDQSVQDSHDAVQLTVSADIALTNHATKSEVISPPDSYDDTPTHSIYSTLHMNEDPDVSDEDINTAFDIDDILNAVKFEDEPKPLKITPFPIVDKQSENEEESAMMMMETSSIASENIEGDEPISKSERPCAFIPPPPPTEPPPPEIEASYPGAASSVSAPVLIDKETEVNEDNTSLAPASMKNSPESVSQNGYKNEMALFVERMSKMAVDENNADGNALNDSLSSGLSLSETNSDTGSVIQHLRTDSSDSKSGQDSGSWSKRDFPKINGIKEAEEGDDSAQLRVSEELTVPVHTVPPPPEFDDVTDKQSNNEEEEEEEEEEEFTETIEELIIPLGPNGFDFTAARKVPDHETSKELTQIFSKESEQSPNKDNEDTSITTGVFRAEPVSIKPSPTRVENQKEVCKKTQIKEEFILTTDDLSSVSFLPPRPKSVSRKYETKTEEPRTSISSAVLIMEKPKSAQHIEEETSTESIQSRVSQISFTPTSELETDPMLEVKPISLLNRPTMRPMQLQDSGSSLFTSDQSSNVSTTPELSEEITSEGNNFDIPDAQDGLLGVSNFEHDSLNKDISDDVATEGSRSDTPTHGLESQYNMLQAQFSQWQEQLAQNQSIISQATGNDLQADQLQQLTAQMTMQQNMMLQIQSTMQALQQQQQQPVMNGNGDKAASVEFLSLNMEQAAAAAEPPPPPPPAPPAPAASGSKATEVSKAGQNKTKSRPKPKFERELAPREQLMIAIRGFQGREGLKSVAKKDTKWIHSNR